MHYKLFLIFLINFIRTEEIFQDNDEITSIVELPNEQIAFGSFQIIEICNLKNESEIKLLDNSHENFVISMIILNNNYLISLSSDLMIVWQINNRFEKLFETNILGVNSIAAFSNDSFLCNMRLMSTDFIYLYNITEKKMKKCFKIMNVPSDSRVESIVLMENNQMIAIAVGNEIQFWNSQFKFMNRIIAHNYSLILSLEDFKDNSKLASIVDYYRIIVWNYKDGKLNKIIKVNTMIHKLVALNKDLLAGACDDALIRIWDSNTGAVIKVLEQHIDAVKSLVLLKNGSLISGSHYGAYEIWNIDEIKKNFNLEKIVNIKKEYALQFISEISIVYLDKGVKRTKITITNREGNF
jgi:WD40 repeat protein